MDGFNIGKILFNLQHPGLLFKRLNNVQQNEPQQLVSETFDTTANNVKQNIQNVVSQNIQQANTKALIKEGDIGTNINTRNQNIGKSVDIAQNIENATRQIQQFNFQGTDKSIFIKNLLGLPQNFGQTLLMVQNPNNPLIGGTLGLNSLNQTMIQPSPVLSSLFSEGTNVQPTAMQQTMAQVVSNMEQKSTQIQQTNALFFSGMISMPEISKLILQNSKQAVAALIIAMASASKQGVGAEQIRETLGIINSCVAMAESNNPAMTLKSLMMLYIPWLPLNEGVGFDMEITPQTGENDSNDSKLTVLIQTKNYGNLKGVFTLTTTNSVDVYIICTDSFPKQRLQDSLNEESKNHAMNTNIDIEDIKPQKEEINETREAKVNLSATNEMNPYLLLMAHSFIRSTISIDNELVGLSV